MTESHDLLTAMLRKAQRALAKSDVATFIEYISGQEPAAHHRDMLDFAIDIVDRKKSGVILAPRGSGKTTILTNGFVPWLIALRPDIRIGLFSQKAEKAEAMSAAIMEIISASPKFIEIFGSLRGTAKWTASEWLRKDSPHAMTKDRTMVTGGAAQSSSAVSKRFDLIICHAKGTPIYDGGKWMAVEDHPTATSAQRDGIEVSVRGLPFSEVVTPEHRYWTIHIPDEHMVTPARRIGFGEQEWREAQDLTSEYAIGWPIDTTVEPPQPIPWNANLGVGRKGSKSIRSGGNDWQQVLIDRPEFRDPDWWWLLGLWWGDGHRTARQIGFTVSSQIVHDRLTQTLDRHGLKWYRFEKPGCWQIVATSTQWAQWVKTWRTGNSRKQPPAWIERVAPEFQAQLLRGYIDADGYVSPKEAEIKITSIHLPGLLSARRMFARLGVPASIRLGPGPRWSFFPNGNSSMSQQKYDLRFSARYAHLLGFGKRPPSYRPNGMRSTFIRDGFLWSRVDSLAPAPQREFIPIHTADHTYLTHFGRSHNCDDVLDENNTATIDQREKLETWFWKTLKPTQAAEGCAVLVIGTRWTEDDLYQRLIETNKWPSLIIPAIAADPATGEETSYWPAIWPLERLYAEREDVGWDNFACSYLNDISGLREGTIFRRDWWKDTYFETLPNDRTYVYTIGIDLASSERERADYTTGVLVARDDRHEHWVLHTARIKTDSGHREFVEGMARWASDHGFVASRIVIENNQSQATLVQQILRDTGLPIVGRRTDTDKRTRARATAARYESHRVHHHESLRGRELETEMLGFPKGHDDLVDALGLAMDLTVGSGTIMGVNAPLRDSTAVTAHPEVGTELPFIDGPRTVSAYLAAMLHGIDTAAHTYDESVALANRARMTDYIRSMTRGFIR